MVLNFLYLYSICLTMCWWSSITLHRWFCNHFQSNETKLLRSPESPLFVAFFCESQTQIPVLSMKQAAHSVPTDCKHLALISNSNNLLEVPIFSQMPMHTIFVSFI